MMGSRDRADPAVALERLRGRAERVLRDELRHGCADRLVQGGLESFLQYWVDQVKRAAPSAAARLEAEAAARALRGYRLLGLAERELALQLALGHLARSSEPGTNVAVPERPPSPPRPSSRMSVAAHPVVTELSRRATVRLPLDAPLEELSGIGPSRSRALARLGLRTYGDLLNHFPARYEHYPPPRPASELLLVQKASYVGTVQDVQVARLKGTLRKTTARLVDPTGQVMATWLRTGQNGPRIAPGQRLAVSGQVQAFGRQVVFENPDWERADAPRIHTRGVVPVYPLTAGISLYWLRNLIHQAVQAETPHLVDFLPEGLRQQIGLPELSRAMGQIHFPEDDAALEEARRRLAFDELLQIQLVALQRRLRWQATGSRALPLPEPAVQALLAAQPFKLTGAQRRVLEEIAADLARSRPMSRLLQGEVGSGKTAVAAVALYVALANGGQGVLMAPTEILAEQHYRTLTSFYDRANAALTELGAPIPRVALLTGSATRRQKEAVYLAVREGRVDLLVGTQAVIQEGVDPQALALSIVDEQHRFGVRQRVDVRGKGQNPHLLVMTATPIPRTMALSLHGDLDISLIDELPPGRQQIMTHLLRPSERPLAYEHIRREVAAGRQAFIICPLVEDSPRLEARAAVEEYERLRLGDLAGLRLGLLHGRLKPVEKDDVMRQFHSAEYDVLVSTSVVEVGVDVPNATVMLIEGAERFGLAQLHQFRGRVGRGEHRSTCILLTEIEGGGALERLEMLTRSNDGLQLAEYDLQHRGPGDHFGLRQSGRLELRVATLSDIGLIERARAAAAMILNADPALEAPEHLALARRLAGFVQRFGEPN
jgi:ATP-dependent DNA helicase RecG